MSLLLPYLKPGSPFNANYFTGQMNLWPAITTAIPIPEKPLSNETEVNIVAWIETCESNHSACMAGNSLLPKRVLELHGGDRKAGISLYESNTECAPYITLSHCWGASHPLTTTQATLNMRKQGIATKTCLELSWMPFVFADGSRSDTYGLIHCVSFKMTLKTGRGTPLKWPTFTSSRI